METKHILGLAAVALTGLGICYTLKCKERIDRAIDEIDFSDLIADIKQPVIKTKSSNSRPAVVLDSETGRVVGLV